MSSAGLNQYEPESELESIPVYQERVNKNGRKGNHVHRHLPDRSLRWF